MNITEEISYYPLNDQYKKPMVNFLDCLSKNTDISITTGIMGSVVAGEYDAVMNRLIREIRPLIDKYLSIF